MRNIKDVSELIRNLECTKHSFYITTYSIAHLYYSYLQGQTVDNFSSMPENLQHFPNLSLHDYLKFYDERESKNDDWEKNCVDAMKSAERTYIKETYEWLQDYVYNANKEEIDQRATFKSQTWYRMARLIRNTYSHNWIISFNKSAKKDIKNNGPIVFHDVSINLNDEGKNMQELGWHRGLTAGICEEMLAFSRHLQ